MLVGQAFDGPVEGDEVREAEVDADAATVALHGLAGVAQCHRAVEQAQAEHRLPPSAFELDRERLDLGPAVLAEPPHLADGVGLVGVDPREFTTPVSASPLLRLRAGVAAFPRAVAGTLWEHQPDVAASVRVDPVSVVDVQLDERDRLAGVAVLEPGEPDTRPAPLAGARLGEVLQRQRGVVQPGTERVGRHVAVPRMHVVTYLTPVVGEAHRRPRQRRGELVLGHTPFAFVTAHRQVRRGLLDAPVVRGPHRPDVGPEPPLVRG
jgi:hypothetical protein